MKVLFVGSKNMGIKGLRILSDLSEQGIAEIVGVIAREDDDEKHWYDSVSRLARKIGLKLLMPDTLKNDDFLNEVKAIKPDIGICCFYPKLFKENFFSIPKHGFLNLHFAPLPRYRGALPIPYAIMNDEKIHGITLHKIDVGMDSGDIVFQELLPIYEKDTGYDLYLRCEKFGEKLLREKLPDIFKTGKLIAYKQNDGEVISHYRKDLKEKKAILEKGLGYFYNFVRAFDFPHFKPAFFHLNENKYFLTTHPEFYNLKNNYPYIAYKDYKIYLIPEIDLSE